MEISDIVQEIETATKKGRRAKVLAGEVGGSITVSLDNKAFIIRETEHGGFTIVSVFEAKLVVYFYSMEIRACRSSEPAMVYFYNNCRVVAEIGLD